MKYLSITITLIMAFASTALMATEIPSDPYRLQVYQNRITETTARIKFREKSTDELGFHIYNNGELLETLDAHEGTGKIRHELQGLSAGTTYNLTVKAFNDEGESGASNFVMLTTQGDSDEVTGLPEAPKRLELYRTRVTETTARIKFRDHATDELGFHIYNDGVLIKTIEAHEGTGKIRVELDGLGDEHTLCGVLNNITVKAFNDLGESEATNRLVFLTEDGKDDISYCNSELSETSKSGLYELHTESGEKENSGATCKLTP